MSAEKLSDTANLIVSKTISELMQSPNKQHIVASLVLLGYLDQANTVAGVISPEELELLRLEAFQKLLYKGINHDEHDSYKPTTR